MIKWIKNILKQLEIKQPEIRPCYKSVIDSLENNPEFWTITPSTMLKDKYIFIYSVHSSMSRIYLMPEIGLIIPDIKPNISESKALIEVCNNLIKLNKSALEQMLSQKQKSLEMEVIKAFGCKNENY